MAWPKSETIFLAVFAFLVFSSILITVSYWAGFIILSTPLILALSIPITFFLWKKFPINPEKIPLEVLLAALLVSGICAFPLLLVTPFYMGSNDALHTTTLRTLEIAGKIPETYAPYSGVSFTYQIGFHLFAKIFSDIFFFIQDFHVLWFLGVLLAAIETILMYLVSKELFKSEKAGKWSALLFVGTKTVYINMYFGMFPRMLASCLVLLFFYLLLKKNRLAFLLVPAVMLVHMGWFICLALLLALFLAFNRKRFWESAKGLPYCLLALPVFFQNIKIYLAYFSKRLLGTGGASAGQQFNFASFTIAFLLGMGWVIGALFGFGFLYTALKKRIDRNKAFALAVFFTGTAAYYFSAIFNFTVDNVYPWLFSLGGVFFVSLFLSEIMIEKRMAKYAKVLLVVLLLMSFFSSSYITSRIQGTKITPQEAAFASKFKALDPELKTVVFLGISAAKTAELSNKIPFNTGDGWFLPFEERLAIHDKAYLRELEKIEIQKKIIETKCAECVFDLNVDYAAINIEKFPALPGKTPVLEQGSIRLYKLR